MPVSLTDTYRILTSNYLNLFADFGMSCVPTDLYKLFREELNVYKTSKLIESFFLAMLDNITANNGEVC